MELQDFIAETISEIIAGVKKAQEQNNGNGVIINAGVHTTNMREKREYFSSPGSRDIEFDIAVTVSDSTQSTAGTKVQIMVFEAGAKSIENTQGATTHRVRFSVPVAFPEHKA